jgi:hypothetical protein
MNKMRNKIKIKRLKFHSRERNGEMQNAQNAVECFEKKTIERDRNKKDDEKMKFCEIKRSASLPIQTDFQRKKSEGEIENIHMHPWKAHKSQDDDKKIKLFMA